VIERRAIAAGGIGFQCMPFPAEKLLDEVKKATGKISLL
jgi:hypothetical protein